MVGDHRGPDVSPEVIEPAPSAACQTVGSFEARDPGLDPGAEVPQLAIDPAALDHVLDREAALLVEGDIAHAARLGGFEIIEAGITAVGGDLPRRHPTASDLAIEHGQETLGIGRVAGLDDDIEDQAALAGGQVELVSVLHVAGALDDDISVRLEQAHQLLASRHRQAVKDPPRALGEDALDQRLIVVDPGAPGAMARSW